jgi:hypothetical protein
MPRWPAYLMGAFAIACAVPAMTAPAPDAPSRTASTADRQIHGPSERPALAAVEPTASRPGAGTDGAAQQAIADPTAG